MVGVVWASYAVVLHTRMHLVQVKQTWLGLGVVLLPDLFCYSFLHGFLHGLVFCFGLFGCFAVGPIGVREYIPDPSVQPGYSLFRRGSKMGYTQCFGKIQ